MDGATGIVTVVYAVEKFQDCVAESSEFFEAHKEEVGADKEKFPLAPDYERYQEMQDIGSLVVVTARADGRLIGYICYYLSRHLHYDSLTAYSDVFYVTPAYRKGLVGVRLFKAVEEVLKHMGVERIYTGTKLKLDIGPILERLGYAPIERIYTKVLI